MSTAQNCFRQVKAPSGGGEAAPAANVEAP